MSKEEQLKAALRWIVDSNVVGYKSKTDAIRFSDAGCGCCGGGYMEPPEELRSILTEVFDS